MRLAGFPLLLALLALAMAAQQGGGSPADRMEQKLRHLEANAAKNPPDSRPTVLTEEEINAYLAEGRMELPRGVEQVQFQGEPGVIRSRARVDFDEVRAGRPSRNPLLALFTGTHDVEVVANASGAGGKATVQVQSVSINGMEVPRMALEFFVERYVKPRWPQAGLDSTFTMPARIHTAEVGKGTLTVTQQ